MERVEQRRIVEALILGSPEPIPLARLVEIVPRARPALVRELVAELNAEYVAQGRAFEVCEVAGGYQVRTLPEYAPYLQQTLKARPLRLSQAALETLAVVAYRQPVTRAEIEHVRGVDVGAVLRSLMERKLVRLAGHREVAGRPLLYATTRRFLEIFDLPRLEDLPTLRDLRELASEPGAEAPALSGSGAAAEEPEAGGSTANEEEPEAGGSAAGAEEPEAGGSAAAAERPEPALGVFAPAAAE
jgi:segregation and condensation protein B